MILSYFMAAKILKRFKHLHLFIAAPPKGAAINKLRKEKLANRTGAKLLYGFIFLR
jgi:hypothetical protein